MAAVASALNQDDWMSLYYRDLAAWLQRTGDMHGRLREAYPRTTGPMGAGRNMPSHYSSKRHRILPTFSEVGALAPFAGGVGFSLKQHKSKDIIMFTAGDGGVATNDFNAIVRQASGHKLPVLMVIEDNGWAITTPSPIQWGGSLVDWAKGAGVYAEEVDGTDTMAAYEASVRLVEYVRAGQGPVLMHLRLGLLDPHSSSTDIKSYRTKEEIEATTATKDPVKNFGRWLVAHGYLQEGDIERIRKEVRAELERAEAQVLQEPEPAPERVLQNVIQIPKWQVNIPRGTSKKFGRGCGRPISSVGAGGGAFRHSNAGEQWFTSVPGMITICPATPFDAKGLLLEAARAQSPVAFLERGRLYRSEPPKDGQGNIIAAMAEYWTVPEGYYTLPIGKARRMLIGNGPISIAIIGWGTMVLESCTAAANSVHRNR